MNMSGKDVLRLLLISYGFCRNIEISTYKNAECDGFLHQSISKCCLNQMNKHRGYKWMYLSDYEAQFNKSKNS